MNSSRAQSTRPAVILAALGVVYGDIGTSPLYAIKESMRAVPADIAHETAALGVVSLATWALVLIVSIKYVLLVMRADNDGEGGIMALTALALRRMAKPRSREWVMALGMIGAALFIGDGMITPAISVLSAVEGLSVATETLEPFMVPIAVMFLMGLFAVQYRGSAHLGRIFGYVMLVWFFVVALVGVLEITEKPDVLRALDPRWGLSLLWQGGFGAALPVLGGVFLVLTGAEALYVDMGHFGRSPIKKAWFYLVMPALILNYLGQAALVLHEPHTADEPLFFLMFPEWAIYPAVLLAMMATIIASQAVISGVFTMVQQAILLGVLPRMEVCQTSDEEAGQIYMPQVNWILGVAVASLVLGFGSSEALAGAYGLSVVITMVTTTVLASFVARHAWGWSTVKTTIVFLPFFLLDISFLGANLLKLGHGGWFPLLIGTATVLVMRTWRKGSTAIRRRLGETTPTIESFVDELPADQLRVPGTAVYLTDEPDKVPVAMMLGFLHNKMLHQQVVLLDVDVARIPYVSEAQQIEVKRLHRGFTVLVIQFGFSQRPDLHRVLARHPNILSCDVEEIVYVIGREVPVPSRRHDLNRWEELVYGGMSRLATGAPEHFYLPTAQVMEIGTRVEL